MSEKGDFLVKRILDKDYAALKDDIESVVAAKVVERVIEKKKDVIEKLNSMKVLSNNKNTPDNNKDADK